MMRYIKVNNKWIDTLEAMKKDDYCYIVVDGIVYNIPNSVEYVEVGELQDETDDKDRII